MTRYYNALHRYAEAHFGEIPSSQSSKNMEEAFQSDLQLIGKNNSQYFWICVAMVVLLFLGAFLLVVFNLSNSRLVEGTFAATGISFFGLIKEMTALWKEKVHSDLLLVLSRKLPPDEVRAIVNVLLGHYESTQPDTNARHSTTPS